MKCNRKWVLAAVVVIGIAAFGISRGKYTAAVQEHVPGIMPLQEHTQSVQEPNTTDKTASAMTITVGEDQLLTMMQETWNETLPVNGLSVEIKENGEVRINGEISKEQIAEMLKKHDSRMAEAYLAALDYFPDPLPLECRLKVQSTTEHTVDIIPLGISAASIEISDDMVTDNFFQEIKDSFNRELKKQLKGGIESVTSKDGQLLISGEDA